MVRSHDRRTKNKLLILNNVMGNQSESSVDLNNATHRWKNILWSKLRALY